MRLARKLGLPPEKVWSLGIYTFLAGLIASRLLMVVTHLALFLFNPIWLLSLSPSFVPWTLWASVAIAAAIALLYLKAEGLPVLSTLDAYAPALAAGFAIQSLGAFFAGANFGTPTHAPLAVTYRSNFAALWYHTPLGMHLVPVQLYTCVVCLVILAGLLLRLPRRAHSGEICGLWLFAYGVAVFFLQFYRGDVFIGGIFTPMQRVALAAVILGALLLFERKPAVQPSPKTCY